jgi:DNA-binding response OmpR family regulator
MAEGNSANAPAILIVEDESLVRLSAAQAVAAAGFEVIEAASADEGPYGYWSAQATSG